MKNLIHNKHAILTALVLFLFPHLSSAQKWEEKMMPAIGVVTGVVVDGSSKKPISYASVSIILLRDNEVITGGITTDEGQFKIEEIPLGKYVVTVEFIGYEKLTTKPINLFPGPNGGGIEQDLGVIELSRSVLQMQELSVTGELPEIIHTSDKLIYVVDKSLTVQGGTAEDVLNNVPMVTVDQDGIVSLRGSSNVKMLVNGRPNRTGEGPNNVDNIPASLIDKVEVITSPSAKYDPDGMAGIINIVLKKEKYEGLNGNLKINGKYNKYNSFDKMNGFTAFGNYKNKKLNLYSSLNINNRVRTVAGYRNVDTYYFDPADSTSTHYILDVDSERPGNSLTLGTDYFINEKYEINGEIRYSANLNNSAENKFYSFPEIDTISTKSADLNGNYNVNSAISVVRIFDRPEHKFSFSLNNNQKNSSGYVELIHSGLYSDRTNLDGKIRLTELNLSYSRPLRNDNYFEIGYDGRLDNNTEFMDFEFTDPADTNFQSFSGTNDFGYKRNIHAVYAEYDYKFNDSFSIKPSGRYEYVDKDISFTSNITVENDSIIYAKILSEIGNQTFLDNYYTFYPDLHFTYKLNEKQNIQFGLSKRVNRPGAGGHGRGSRSIRPFPRDLYSPSFIFIGNPFLKPEYSTQYDISFKSSIPMGFAYSNLYFHQLDNIIEWVDDDRFEDADVLTFGNADSGTKIGVELFAMFFGQTIGGGYSKTELEDDSKDYELNGTREHISIYSRISLPEKYIKFFDFEFGFYYMNIKVPGGSLFGKNGTLWANSGISKSFLEDKVTVSLSINNLFDSGGFRLNITKPLIDETGYYANEFTDVNMSRHPRTFTINIKFRFGQMQDEKRKNRRGMEHGDEDAMDMGY